MFIQITQGSDEYIATLGCSPYALRAMDQLSQQFRQQIFMFE